MTKTRDIEKKTDAVFMKTPRKPFLNFRDYIIPTGWKKKRNISGNIDKFLYGGK